MMIRNFDVRQKSTGDVIVRLGTAAVLLLLRLRRRTTDPAATPPDTRRWRSQRNLRHLARVDRREQSGVEVARRCSVLPVRHRMKKHPAAALLGENASLLQSSACR